MGQVVAIKQSHIRKEVVDCLEGQCAKASCGELSGCWSVGVTASGAWQLIFAGTLADDPAYAAKMISDALDAFCEQTGSKKREAREAPTADRLPRRLRRN